MAMMNVTMGIATYNEEKYWKASRKTSKKNLN